MNKYQKALFKIRKSRVIEKLVGGVFINCEILSIEEVLEEESNLLKELVDKATPKKPIIVKEIGDYDEDGFSKSYEYEVTKCEGCNTVLVDLETDEIDRSGEPFCFNCGQAILWKD